MMEERRYSPADLAEGFVVAIQLEAKPNCEHALADSLQTLIAPTMAEPGVKLFLPYRSRDEPRIFFVFEVYVDEAGWGAHQETAHFKAFVDEMLPKLAKRERIPFVPFAVV